MSYKIIVDSCGELSPEMKVSGHFTTASLSIDVDDYHVIDDETFNQKEFLERVAASPNCPRSSCPSPNTYMEKFHCDADHVYAVTLSAELSGSYNSAVLGVDLYKEEYGEKKIHVFNSKSASIGETLIAMKIAECEDKGMTFGEVIDTVETYIEDQHTYFLLESLEALRKNGRLTGLKAMVATALSIKPVMGATPEGTICQLGQARGMKKALVKMADEIAAHEEHAEDKILAISHCNCPTRAEELKKLLLARLQPKNVIILDTAGISSLYASDGGVIAVI